MRLTLTRDYPNEQIPADTTYGVLRLGNHTICQTLEDEVRPLGVKVPGKTAIPLGIYAVSLTYSPKFKRILPLLRDVPNFTGIRIHTGNNKNHTEGCILVGLHRSPVTSSLSRSQVAFDTLLTMLENSPTSIMLEII